MKQEERKQLMHQIASQISNCQNTVCDFRDRIQKLIRHRQTIISKSANQETVNVTPSPPATDNCVKLPAPQIYRPNEDLSYRGSIEEKTRERTNFSPETKSYVMTLGSRLKATLNISTLKAARLVSKELKINQRTVYSWLKNYS